MELIDTKTLSAEMVDRAWRLMENSFPLNEQRSLEQHIIALNDSAFHPDAIIEDGKFVGILYYWIYDENYIYIEHLATDPQIRGGGYGRRAMEILIAKGYKILLEIEPPVDEITIRRRGFYERLGFVMNQYLHIHPSYRPTTSPHQLYVMSYPGAITEQEFDSFKKYSLEHVLHYVDR